MSWIHCTCRDTVQLTDSHGAASLPSSFGVVPLSLFLMNFHFGKETSTGKEQLTVTRTPSDTDETLEDFAKTLKGSVRMIHNTDANGKVRLDEIIVTLD